MDLDDYGNSATGTHDDESALVAALRAGDEAAFASVIDRYYGLMLHVARMHVATVEAAEDVVQETFLGVIRGIDRFEARSSLKTWMFRILVNRARTRGERDARTKPFSSFATSVDDEGAVVDPERFVAEGRWNGFWASAPPDDLLPEALVLATEGRSLLLAAIDELPEVQRAVITLRDVQGLEAPEVCDLLSISDGNQRVLLHRARSRVRTSLERYYAPSAEAN